MERGGNRGTPANEEAANGRPSLSTPLTSLCPSVASVQVPLMDSLITLISLNYPPLNGAINNPERPQWARPVTDPANYPLNDPINDFMAFMGSQWLQVLPAPLLTPLIISLMTLVMILWLL